MSTRNLSDAGLTDAVVASFDGAGDDRVKTVLSSLTRHLHAFASEVELTQDEWFAGVDFLTRTGHITDDRRQEFVLLSDVLGLSMLTVGINNRRSPEATESTVFGPFFVAGSPGFADGEDLGAGAPGEPCWVDCTIRTVGGEPVAGAHVEVWQADEAGFYDVQYDGLDEPRGRGHLAAGDDGSFRFWSVKPVAYPIPADGPVGELLAAAGRGPMRPAHIHFLIRAAGFETLITHVFADGDEHLDSDAVFGVRSGLVAPFERHEGGTAPDGRVLDGPWWTMTYDFVLEAA